MTGHAPLTNALTALVLAVAMALTTSPTRTFAQAVGVVETDVLVIDTDRLFAETLFGEALRDDYEKERAALIAENRKTEAALEAEEQALTKKRATMTPEAFRALADAFDDKVQRIRSDKERIALDLERKREQAPVLFLRRIQPILADLMQESDAVAILDARTVLMRIDDVDATGRAIKEVNERIGNGKNDP